MRVINRSLADQAFEIVRERILSAELPPLSSIRQDALASELGISKIPLREALTRLEQNGLLRSSLNKGFVVPALDPDEAEEIFELRLRLEPDAAARACLNASEVQQQAAIAFHAAMQAVKSSSKAALTSSHRQFHLSLVTSDSHKLTIRLLERLHALADRYVCFHLQPIGRAQRASSEHADLLDAWLARDSDRVRTLLEHHLSTTLHDLRAQLSEPVPAKPAGRKARSRRL
jgi:DNA-binding GntR family transcriptional regulator